ncbi:MAG: 50S ribosomal protein L35 [Candidatus Magasanikbacteria bacterium]
MAKDSIKDRLKVTKNGKVKHRTPGKSHCKSNKSNPQKQRRKGDRDMDISENKAKKLMNE